MASGSSRFPGLNMMNTECWTPAGFDKMAMGRRSTESVDRMTMHRLMILTRMSMGQQTKVFREDGSAVQDHNRIGTRAAQNITGYMCFGPLGLGLRAAQGVRLLAGPRPSKQQGEPGRPVTCGHLSGSDRTLPQCWPDSNTYPHSSRGRMEGWMMCFLRLVGSRSGT